MRDCHNSRCRRIAKRQKKIRRAEKSRWGRRLIEGARLTKLHMHKDFASAVRFSSRTVQKAAKKQPDVDLLAPLAECRRVLKKMKTENPLRSDLCDAVQLFEFQMRLRGRAPAAPEDRVAIQRELFRVRKQDDVSVAKAVEQLRVDRVIENRLKVPGSPQATAASAPSGSSRTPTLSSTALIRSNKPFVAKNVVTRESVSRSAVKKAPHRSWKPMQAVSARFQSRTWPRYILCNNFNTSGCRDRFATCSRVHACLDCRSIGHGASVCKNAFQTQS